MTLISKVGPSRQQLTILARLADGHIDPHLTACTEKVRNTLVSYGWVTQDAEGYRVTALAQLFLSDSRPVALGRISQLLSAAVPPGLKASLVWMLAIAGILGLGPVLNLVEDVYTYQDIQVSQYQTPWFDQRWWVQPYTHFQLAQHPQSERWTKNAIGSEYWLVREVQVGTKQYWTALKRIPVDPAMSSDLKI